MTLKSCLEQCSVVELRAMARRQELRLQSLLKADIISQLERRILDGVESGRFRQALPEDALAALDVSLNAAGTLPLDTLRSRFGDLRKCIPGAIDSRQPWSDGLTTPLDLLHIFGLLFHGPEVPGQDEQAVVPQEVVERLRPEGLPKPRVFRACAPPPVAPGVCPAICADLMLLTSALRAAPANRLAGGGVSRRDLLRLNAQLLVPDEIADTRTERLAHRFFFIRSLGESLSLVRTSENRFQVGPQLPDWLEMPPGEQRARLLSAYFDLSAWSELHDSPTIEFAVPPSPAVVSAARRFIVELLSDAEPDEWYSIASLIQAARSRNPFLLRRPDDGSLVRCTQSGRELTPRDWPLVEGAWIEAVTRGPLCWLGMVESGKNRRGELTSFRVPRAALPYLRLAHGDGLDITAMPPDTRLIDRVTIDAVAAHPQIQIPVPQVVVDDDLGVNVPIGTNLKRWFRLERICDLLQRGPVSRYRVAREKVRQLLQEGITHEEILSDLGESVPAAVRTTLAGWSNRFGQVRVFAATLVSAADPALISELRSVPEIACCLGQGLGAKTCVVQPGKEAELINLLRSRGEMPHVEPAPARCPVDPAAWSEIHQALLRWQQSAAKSDKPGPSTATCELIARLAGESPAHPDQTGLDPAGSDRAGSVEDPASTVALLEEAIRRKQPVAFDYSDTPDSLPRRIVVLPRSLGQQNGVTFIAGYRKGGSRIDRFRLDRISKVAPSAP